MSGTRADWSQTTPSAGQAAIKKREARVKQEERERERGEERERGKERERGGKRGRGKEREREREREGKREREEGVVRARAGSNTQRNRGECERFVFIVYGRARAKLI